MVCVEQSLKIKGSMYVDTVIVPWYETYRYYNPYSTLYCDSSLVMFPNRNALYQMGAVLRTTRCFGTSKPLCSYNGI